MLNYTSKKHSIIIYFPILLQNIKGQALPIPYANN